MPARLQVLLFALLLPVAGAGAAPTATARDDQAGARKLYAAKCASCHQLHDPARYDDAQWTTWMKKMKRKARLSDDQDRQLTSYLASLRPPAAAGALAPPGRVP